MKNCFLALVLIIALINAQGQPVPSPEENIPWIITFGNKAHPSWGDPDYSQVFFFVVPQSYSGAVYIRVFDADTGGLHDELNGSFDTRCTYSVYGGMDAYTHPEAQKIYPKGNYKTGNLLASRTFGVDPRWDNNWYTFGPFDPKQGEHVPQYGGYIFKVVCEGIDGDDGNVYNYFMSSSANENIPIEGGNAFTFEYKFRLHENSEEHSHIYPYVDIDDTRSIRTQNFDWDNDGTIRVTSEVRREQRVVVSSDNVWAVTDFAIMEGEKGKSLNFQFIPKGVRNNNVVISVQNQKGENMKLYSSPIGGVPRYKYSIEARRVAPQNNR